MPNSTRPLPQVRKALAEEFSEWGPLEDVYVVPLKTLAFVR